ncbi:RNA polymerase factor sigma-54 [Parvularcula sp. LCG005]|nr:RNA polymerase factor sigma-54 [Parvularcula sp. LCG005]WOI52897.1 RNA polymerase factor sigma-54 [Parvularcula sp. LCG005]
MSISQKLEVRQGQQLVMTPQLQQAIKLLQLTNLELAEFVESQLEENPFLERDESGSDPQRGDEARGEERADADASADHSTLDTDYSNIDNEAAPGDAGAGDWSSVSSRGPSLSDDYDAAENTGGVKSLHDHLTDQLHVTSRDDTILFIGSYLIDLIDDGGYLRDSTNEIAERLGADLSLVEKALRLIQNFEPSGVGARSLQECLKLQLRDLGELTPGMELFLENIHFLGTHNMPALRRACRLNDAELKAAIATIRRLNPKPGLQYGRDHVQVVVPDVYVTEDADGGWKVELNSETLPRVIADERYFTRLAASTKGGEARTFLNEQMANANWLVRSLDQRARTILRVATELVKYQDEFFVNGIRYLRPLNLKTIADSIEMHESTVSRVTSNKFIATPRGTFEMKYFFTAAISSRTGDAEYSAESVRHRIRQLIDEEEPENPLSDDRLVSILAGENIDIARRTVAKYREALGLPSSVQRRRMAKRSLA